MQGRRAPQELRLENLQPCWVCSQSPSFLQVSAEPSSDEASMSALRGGSKGSQSVFTEEAERVIWKLKGSELVTGTVPVGLLSFHMHSSAYI